MKPGRIEGSNMLYHAPESVDPEDCGPLYVRAEECAGVRVCTSAWYPTMGEIDRLLEGKPLHLSIFGQGHPMIALTVRDDT